MEIEKEVESGKGNGMEMEMVRRQVCRRVRALIIVYIKKNSITYN